jgi:lipopolysaccharide heptosyltransferase II
MAQSSQAPALDEYGYPLRPDTKRQFRNKSVLMSKRILRLSIIALMSIIGAFLWLRRIGTRRQPLSPQSFAPKHILVVRLDLIGDLVLSLSVVHLLKRTYPDAEIDLLALPSSAKIATSDPNISEIIPYDPNIWRRPQALLRVKNWSALWALRKRLHAQHYDLAVNVFGNWGAVLAVLSSAKRLVGFKGEAYPGFLTDSVPGRHWSDPAAPLHEVDYCLQLAQAAGASISPDDRIPQLAVAPQARQEIEHMLLQEGIQPASTVIACHVSSNNGQSKRWPIPYWATLIDRLIREDGNSVVLTGAANDLPLIALILQRTHEQPVNLAGKTSLTQLAALLQRADMVITGDSGPMHIAAAVGSNLLAIHGPTNPAHSGPLSPKARVLRSDIWCSPCYNAKSPADCRFFTTQCMKNIVPDQVLNVIHEKLQDRHVDRQEAID